MSDGGSSNGGSAVKKDFSRVQDRLRRAREGRDGKSRPSATGHIESVEAQIAAIARGDYESALSGAAPDVELDIFAPPEFPFIRKARGIAELRHALAVNFQSVVNQDPEVNTVVTEEDVLVVIGRERGEIRETGLPYEVEFVHRFTFRDGRLIGIRVIVAKAS